MANTGKAPQLKAEKMKSYDEMGTYWKKTPEYREEFHLDITKKNDKVC